MNHNRLFHTILERDMARAEKLAVAVTLLALSACDQFLADNDGKSIDQTAIKQCWESHDNKSTSPKEQHFIAEACKKMEDNFLQKHGEKP